MQKKCVFSAILSLVILLAYSCRMPDSIEIRTGNRELSFPLSLEVNFAELFRDVFEDAIDYDEDITIRVFDMVDVRHAQAFLVAIELGMIPSFNPGDHLEFLGDQDDMGNFTVDVDPISVSVPIPDVTWNMTETFDFDMDELFGQLYGMLHGKTIPESHHPFPLSGNLSPLPPALIPPGTQGYIDLAPELGHLETITFMDFDLGEGRSFDTVIADMKITIELRVNPRGIDPNAGLSITMTDMILEGVTNRETGEPFDPWDATLTHENNFQYTVEINLPRAEVGNEIRPQFSFGYLRVEWDDLALVMETGGFDLFINTNLEDINFRGATGLIFEPIEQYLPDNILDTIANSDLGNMPDGFLNAKIGTGALNIDIGLPSRIEGVYATYVEGLDMSGRIYITQDPTYFNGLTFPGISDPWVFEGQPYIDLSGTTINGGNLTVNPTSFFLVGPSPGGMTFELFGDYDTLPIEVGLEISLDVLEAVRWNMGYSPDFDIEPVTVDFAEISGDVNLTDIVHSLTFGDITIKVKFDEHIPAIDERIYIAIKSEELGFDEYKGLMTDAPNYFIGGNVTLDFTQTTSITVDIDLEPAGGSYLEIGPLNLNEMGGYLNLSAKIDVSLAWTEAAVSIDGILEQAGIEGDTLSGGVPDEPIEFGAVLGDFMSGFTFASGSLALGMYLEGPVDLVNLIEPRIRLTADGYENPLIDQYMVFEDGTRFPELPDDDIFVGTSLPPGGLDLELGGFLQMIAEMPDYLSFYYEVEIGKDGIISVTPGMFDGVDGDDIRAMIILKVVLDFDVYAGGYFSLPMFDDDQADLFGRDDLDDPLFGVDGLTLDMLRLRIAFDNTIFQGARLHLDAEGLLFGQEGLQLNDGRSGNLDIAIRQTDWDIINGNLIPPDIRIRYPVKQENLRITRNFLPTSITVTASGTYTLTFND